MAEDNKTEEDRKADADAGQKLDKVLECVDSICKRMDALEASDKARKDAEDEKAAATKSDEGAADEPERVAADKKRKDAEEQEREDKARKDEEESKAMADAAAAEIKQRIADVEAKLPKERSDADYAALADAQARADVIFQAHGDSAPRPLLGEDEPAYRLRLASKLKAHSPKLKDVVLSAVADSNAFKVMEDMIYADAMQAALKPVDLPEGELREIKHRDTTGRTISTFAGEPRAWMRSHAGQRSRARIVPRQSA